jgi:rubrerythrin
MSNPKKSTDLGLNRTGAGLRPLETDKTIAGAREGTLTRSFDPMPMEAVRAALSQIADPVGTMPPPPTLKGMAKAGLQALKGNNPNVLLDLLGARLAFERSGTRLYEALLAKLDAADHPGGEEQGAAPTRAALEQIRDEELQHAGILIQAIEKLGADPTVLTPTADVSFVASEGALKVVADPRSTLTHALHAVVVAELTDADCWNTLQDLAARLGHEEMAVSFGVALAEEEAHLATVRLWLTSALEAQAGVEPREIAVEEESILAP